MLLTEYTPPFPHSSFPTSSSPEKRAQSTEITVGRIFIAQRNVTAFMEMRIFKTCIDCDCIKAPAVDATQLLEMGQPLNRKGVIDRNGRDFVAKNFKKPLEAIGKTRT